MRDNDVTLPVLITNKLWEYKNIGFSGYHREHPLMHKIDIVVKGKNVKETLKKAVKELREDFEGILKSLK